MEKNILRELEKRQSKLFKDIKLQKIVPIDYYGVYSTPSMVLDEKDSNRVYNVIGRITQIKILKNIVFLNLLYEGSILQIMVPPELHKTKKLEITMGNFVMIIGSITKSETGTLSLSAQQVQVLSKYQLNVVPHKREGLKDHNLLYRNRGIDLIFSKEVYGRF